MDLNMKNNINDDRRIALSMYTLASGDVEYHFMKNNDLNETYDSIGPLMEGYILQIQHCNVWYYQTRIHLHLDYYDLYYSGKKER